MPRARAVAVDVVGLKDLQRELRKVGPEFPKELRRENHEVARYVLRRAEGTAARVGGVAAHAAPGMKTRAEQRYALIQLDTHSHPEILGAEFGGGALYRAGNPKSTTGKRPGFTSQFEPWRGNGPDAGYFLYPTIRAETDEIVDRYGDLVDRVTAKAFPDKRT